MNKKMSKTFIAGILLIIAGVLGLITWASVFGFDTSTIYQTLIESGQNTISEEDLQSVLQICSVVGIIVSLFPIIGGILSIKRKIWVGALACAIIGIFTVGPAFISSVLALIATVLIATAKTEFQKDEQKPEIKEYDDSF
jgi:hypothetical protein